MADDLARIHPTRRSGDEPLHTSGRALGLTLLDFWRWSSSDLVSNALRGVLAEFIVANALGIVLALLAHQDKPTVDPLDVSQWRFFVLPAAVLDARTRSQHSITLRSLEALAGAAVTFGGLRATVRRAVMAGESERP